MPGLALMSGEGFDLQEFARALACQGRPGDTQTLVYAGQRLLVGYSSYPGYPIRTLEGGGGVAVLEGAAYALRDDHLDSRLRVMAGLYAADADRGRSEAERFARQTDGDFVLLLFVPAQDRFLLLNDTLGRLPLFYLRDDRSFALAREVKVLREWRKRQLDPDRLAIAQTLLFGWPFGARTIEKGVLRLLEASTIEVDKLPARVAAYDIWNFDEFTGPSKNFDAAAELAEFFVERCIRFAEWAGRRQLVVSLSGGLDSRAVAAALARAGVSFTGVTFANAEGTNHADVSIAKQVAVSLEVPWKLYRLDKSGWDEARNLVRLRDGQTYITIAHILEFLARVVHDFPGVCYVTGDGGDKALQELSYPLPAKNRDALVNAIVANAIWRVGQVASFLSITQDEIVESIREQYAAFPERTPEGWRSRFAYAEHGWRWLFEGEDRNRAFMWSMTPFYAQSFYRRALAVPAQKKRGCRYYADFLRALDPAVASIPNANWGAPMRSTKAIMREILQSAAVRLPRALKEQIRRRVISFHSPAQLNTHDREEIARLLSRLGNDGGFATTEVAAALESGCSSLQYEVLVTQLLYQELRRTEVPASYAQEFRRVAQA